MRYIIIILACLPLYVMNSYCDKYASSKGEGKQNVFYNTLKFLIGSAILLPVFLADTKPRFSFGALFCGGVCGIMYAINKTLMIYGLKKCSISFMTLCHAGGMIIPCIIGHFFWGERIGILSLCGIVLAIVSIFLLKEPQQTEEKKGFGGIWIGIIVLLTSGGVMIAQKLMGKYFAEQSVSAFNFYSFIVAFAILLLFNIPKKGERPVFKKSVMLCASGSAVALCVISLVMTWLTAYVPSIIMFPLFNGIGIILVSVLSVLFFKEKFTKRKLCGLLIGVAGLCLVNF